VVVVVVVVVVLVMVVAILVVLVLVNLVDIVTMEVIVVVVMAGHGSASRGDPPLLHPRTVEKCRKRGRSGCEERTGGREDKRGEDERVVG
jgi:hypothetical protein